MRSDRKNLISLSFATLATVLTGPGYAAEKECAPTPPALCYSEEKCCTQYCLGPEEVAINASVNPKTCDGDFLITVAGFYWRADQDGLEYAVLNKLQGTDGTTANEALNNLVDAHYLTPGHKWDFGFKLGLGYSNQCDGWDANLIWTKFRDNAVKQDNADPSDNQTFIPLWSAFAPANAGMAPILFSDKIDTSWKVDLNLVDLELGRDFWMSKYVALRPYLGLRFAWIEQDFEIEYQGGSWSNLINDLLYNEVVDLDNDFHGVGVRSGLGSTWNLGCGWALNGNVAISIIYGRFHTKQNENLRLASSPFTKNKILESFDDFRASRAIADMGLGVQWSSLFCECRYSLTIGLGWEQHLFFNQNQLWRVVRINAGNDVTFPPFNDTGDNVFKQQRGTLTTGGWTLTADFAF